MGGNDFKNGFSACLPVAVSVGAYGSVLGVLASAKGLSWLTLAAMNLFIFAGSSQFVLVEMWNPPLPVFEMVLAVAVINLRYLLIGASLHPVFAASPLPHKAGIMHLAADENWALTMAASRNGPVSPRYLFGGGVCLFTAWGLGTMCGLVFGAAIADPRALALDFAFTAVFLALCLSLWRGRADFLPWAVAAGLALLGNWLLPGKWYILLGGVGGALVAMVNPGAPKKAAP